LFGDDAPRIEGGGGREEAVRSLFHRFAGRFVRIEGGQLVARFSPGLDARAITALTRELVQLAWREPSVTVAPRPSTVGQAVQASPSAGSDLRCPYCHDHLPQEALVVHCAGCDAPYHPSCFEEGDGCSIPGCGQRKASGQRVKG
jgi:hypothetical protein